MEKIVMINEIAFIHEIDYIDAIGHRDEIWDGWEWSSVWSCKDGWWKISHGWNSPSNKNALKHMDHAIDDMDEFNNIDDITFMSLE